MKKLIDSLLGDALGGADDIRAALKRDHEELLELTEALCEGSGGENRRQRFARFKDLLRCGEEVLCTGHWRLAKQDEICARRHR
jgi:hypothetical protein